MATRIRLPSQRPNRVGPAPTQGGPATTGSVQVRNVPHQDNPSVYENRVSPTGQAANYVSNGPNDTQLSNHGPSLSVGSGGSIGIEGRAAAAGVGGAAMGAGGHEPLYDFRAAVVQPANFNGGGGVGPNGFNYAASPASRSGGSDGGDGGGGGNGGKGPTGADPLPYVPPTIPTADNHAPIMTDTGTSGAVTELTTTPGLNYLTSYDVVGFTDVDTSDQHFLTSITPLQGPLGTLTASIIFDSTGTGTGGEVFWQPFNYA